MNNPEHPLLGLSEWIQRHVEQHGSKQSFLSVFGTTRGRCASKEHAYLWRRGRFWRGWGGASPCWGDRSVESGWQLLKRHKNRSQKPWGAPSPGAENMTKHSRGGRTGFWKHSVGFHSDQMKNGRGKINVIKNCTQYKRFTFFSHY